MPRCCARSKVGAFEPEHALNLLLLAPDIQEQILFLPRTVSGRDPISEHMLRHVGATPVWSEQRKRWAAIASDAGFLDDHTERAEAFLDSGDQSA
ncbi:MAG: hypothetical protein MJD61_07400 [Proteobacteria bacterium]|nr:hypothetical protein [Pseudomonadota bacterium]